MVTEFNGKKVTDSRHLKLQVADVRPGDTVPVTIMRDGHVQHLTVKVGELPGEPSVIKASANAPDKSDVLNGVGVTDLSAQERREFNLPERVQGALITSVEDDSASAEAGLKPGDVILEINHQAVKNSADAIRLTEKATDKVTLVKVWSQGGAHYVVVDESKAT